MKKKRRLRRKTKNMIMTVFMVICIGVFAFSVYKIASTLLVEKNASDTYDELRTVYHASAVTVSPDQTETEETQSEETETETEEEEETVYIDFATLQGTVPDLVGWIQSEGTYIDYPVMQGDDNKFYLDHLYNGKYYINGSIYMDYRNTNIDTDKNVILYGHHTWNNVMFTCLLKYKEQSYYDSHPTMVLTTPGGKYLIELFSGTVEDGNVEFVRFNLNTANIVEYTDEVRARSTFQSSVVISPEDRIISLCTCSFETENSRYMLLGKLTPIE